MWRQFGDWAFREEYVKKRKFPQHVDNAFQKPDDVVLSKKLTSVSVGIHMQ